MKKNSRFLLYIGLTLGIVAYIVNRYVGTGSISAGWFTMLTTLFAVFPWVLMIMINILFIIRGSGRFMSTTLLFATLGLFFGEFFMTLNNEGVWIDEIVTATFTINDLISVVFFLFLFLGVIVAVYKGRR